jgi:hypothetical protein
MRRTINILLLLFALGLYAQSALAQSWSPSGPTPRQYHSAVLDTKTNRMIVFGGLPGDTSSLTNLNDVWRLTGVGGSNLSWQQVLPTGTPPAGRLGHSAVYDSGSNRMIIFGGAEGRSSPCENDVWVLTNANGNGGTPAWIQLSPAGTPPSIRTEQGGAYDPNTNTLIIFAGQDCFHTSFSDVWVLSNANGVSGTPTWSQLSPSGTGPGECEIGNSIAYDSTNNRLMVFACSTTDSSNGAWVLSNANGTGGTPTWTELAPTGTLPTGRGNSSATFDPKTNTLTIFGGNNSSGNLLGDAWVLTNANGLGGTPTWTQLAVSSVDFPEPRNTQTAVYNPSFNKMTVFGGQINNNEVNTGPFLLTNDVFVLSKANGK